LAIVSRDPNRFIVDLARIPVRRRRTRLWLLNHPFALAHAKTLANVRREVIARIHRAIIMALRSTLRPPACVRSKRARELGTGEAWRRDPRAGGVLPVAALRRSFVYVVIAVTPQGEEWPAADDLLVPDLDNRPAGAGLRPLSRRLNRELLRASTRSAGFEWSLWRRCPFCPTGTMPALTALLFRVMSHN